MSEQNFDLYRDIAKRTDGDVYIGVVGPVRTGKSTLISRMMEELVLSRMAAGPRRERLTDELPQSGSGKTIMTTQPKFVPSEAVSVTLDDQSSVRVRMVDSVGYLVEGALGTEEDGASRMVHTPWFDYDIPFEQAAEIGTRKVITDHATIGLVVTTDGSIADLSREAYQPPEERVVRELKEIGKPFILILNSRHPEAEETLALRQRLSERYGVPALSLNVKEMGLPEIQQVFQEVLYQFPLREIRVSVPGWLNALDEGHWLVQHVLEHVKEAGAKVSCMRDQTVFAGAFADSPYTDGLRPDGIELGTGRLNFALPLKDGLFNRILGEECGTTIEGDAHLLRLMKELVAAKSEYDHVADALRSVRAGHAHHERADPAGAGDRPAGQPLRGTAEGQRAQPAPDPGGHRNGGLPRRRHGKAERGAGQISIGGVPKRPPDHLEHELLRQKPARAGAGGPCQQADAHAHRRPRESTGDPQQDHQRRQRRHDLYPPLGRG